MEEVCKQMKAMCSTRLPDSNELITLCLEDGKTLEVQKVVFGLASPVLRDVLLADPGCKELKVKGDLQAWQQIMALIHPGVDCPPRLGPVEVEAMLPVAHIYDITRARQTCSSSVAPLDFKSGTSDKLYVLKWLGLSGRYHAPAVATACVKYIASLMARSCVNSLMYADEVKLVRQFSPENIAKVEGPPEMVAALGAMYEGMEPHMKQT